MKKKLVVIIDGQGGGIGRQLTISIKENFPDITVRAIGTNTIATQSMIKAGADEAATGENAVITGCREADIIVGPLGIVIADSLLGEITPSMAIAVGQSKAIRFLIPLNQCDNQVVGIENFSLSYLVRECIDLIRKQLISNE
ncbi:DUF3842 family protein [Methanobrevibacter sp.]|uniref:DUF3842 family protein n=1 Tax=Methanobrevibacter sp. TaxID=66852 RepID=UPI00388D20A9